LLEGVSEIEVEEVAEIEVEEVAEIEGEGVAEIEGAPHPEDKLSKIIAMDENKTAGL